MVRINYACFCRKGNDIITYDFYSRLFKVFSAVNKNMKNKNYEKRQELKEEELVGEKDQKIISDIDFLELEKQEEKNSESGQVSVAEINDQKHLLEDLYVEPVIKEAATVKEISEKGVEEDSGEESFSEVSWRLAKKGGWATAKGGGAVGLWGLKFMGKVGIAALKFGAGKIKDAGVHAFNVAFRPWEANRGKTLHFPGKKKENRNDK